MVGLVYKFLSHKFCLQTEKTIEVAKKPSPTDNSKQYNKNAKPNKDIFFYPKNLE